MKKVKIKLRYLVCVFVFFVMFIFNCISVKAYDENVASKLISMIQTESSEEENSYNLNHTNRLVVKTYEKIDLMGAVDYVFDEGYYVLQYKNIEDSQRAYNYYSSLDYVEGVETDSMIEVVEEASFSYYTWGANYMGIANYSNYLVDMNNSTNMKEIVVAVLDSGIDTDHEWFQNRVVAGGKNFSSSTNSGGYEYEDKKGHGTHVSGIIVDLTLDNVKILPIKVLNDEGNGSVISTINAIKYVIDLKEKGMNVVAINMSLGGELSVDNLLHSRYEDVIAQAYDAGIITVAASGNESDDVKKYSPANIYKALTVSAVAQSCDSGLNDCLELASFSNYGSYVDVTAPGQDIYSAVVGGGKDYKSGTSMAAPHVSATVALLASDNSKNYTIDQIEELIIDTAIDIGTNGWDSSYGYGLVNLEKAYVTKMNNVFFSNTNKVHTNELELFLSSDEPNAVIYYTIDGSEPTLENGNIYKSPINIYKTTQVKAVAYVFYKDKVIKQSDVQSHSYYFNGYDLESSYTISNDGMILSYSGELEVLVVPKKINGITVTKIGANVFKNSKLIKITLPNTIDDIGDSAFENLKSLMQIVAPSVVSIGNSAFKYCTGLSKIDENNFPKLQYIGGHAFYGCRNLVEVNLPNLVSIGEYGFYNCSKLEVVSTPSLENILEHAFFGNTSLKQIDAQKVKILGTVTSSEIKGSVFGNCTSLEELYLPSVEIMGSYLFFNTPIKKLVISDDLKKIDNSFSKNSELTVYGYKSSLIETFCVENEVEFVRIEKLKIINNLLDEKYLNNFSENAFLEAVAEGYGLTYNWFEVDLYGEFTDLNINEKKFDIDETNDDKNYFVRITDWEGNFIDSNISKVIYTVKMVYNIVSTIEGKGSVYPSTDITVIENQSAHISFIPNNGYEVKEIIIDGQILENDKLLNAANNGYTFTNVNENHNIEVNYGKKFYTIEYERVVGGVSQKEEFKVEYESDLEIYIQREEHYHVDTIIVGSYYLTYSEIQNAINNKYVFSNVSANSNIKVIFVIDTYEIKVEQEGIIEIQIMKYGSEYKVNYKYKEGYYIESIVVDGKELDVEEIDSFIQTGGYVFKNIENNHYIKISTQKYKYKIISTSHENGSVTPEGEIVVEYGDDVHFDFIPEKGYKVSKILISGRELTGSILENAISNGYDLYDINGDCEIEVMFEIKKFIIEASVIGKGEINPSGNIVIEYGQRQEFIITPEDHYHVENILVGGESLNSSQLETAIKDGYIFENIENNSSIIVEIKIDTYTIDFKSDENGKTIPSEQVTVDYGSQQNVLFIPNTGYEVDKIFVDGKELDQLVVENASRFGYLFSEIDNAHDIEVTYKLKTYTVEFIVKGNGKVNMESKSIFTHGQSIEIGFTSFENNKLSQLKINNNSIDDEDELKHIEDEGYEILEITMDYVIEVIFDKITHTIETIIDGEATVYPGENVSVKDGESKALMLDVKDNNYIAYIYINNVALPKEDIEMFLSDAGYTFTNVKSPKSIRVIVREKIFTVSSSSEGEGFISPQGNIQVKYNQSQKFRFFPVKGYEVKSIVIDGEILENELESIIKDGYLFENVKENHSIFVTFERVQYTINAIVTEGGKISFNGDVIVNSNDSKEFLFEANEGYYIKDVIVDNISKGVLESYNFPNVSKNHSIKVIYEIKTFDVLVTIQGKGNIDCNNDLVNIPYGSSRELSVVPDESSVIKEIFVDGTQVETKEILNLENIKKNMEIKIVFEKKSDPEQDVVGVGCSKQESGNISDFLFIIVGLLVVAFPKKRFFKI